MIDHRYQFECSRCTSHFVTSHKADFPAGWLLVNGVPICASCIDAKRAAMVDRHPLSTVPPTDRALRIASEVTRQELIEALKLAHESISADPKRPALARYLHMIVHHAEGRPA